MKKIIAATLFCATIAVPAVAQGPHSTLVIHGVSPAGANAAANLVPVSGAVAAPVAGTAGLYGGDMATEKPTGALSLPSGPAPSFAWLMALGFLGLVILRRTRSSNGF